MRKRLITVAAVISILGLCFVILRTPGTDTTGRLLRFKFSVNRITGFNVFDKQAEVIALFKEADLVIIQLQRTADPQEKQRLNERWQEILGNVMDASRDYQDTP
jgi:hypothetical protein